MNCNGMALCMCAVFGVFCLHKCRYHFTSISILRVYKNANQSIANDGCVAFSL